MQAIINQKVRFILAVVAVLLLENQAQAQVFADLESGIAFPGRYNRIQVPANAGGTIFDAFGPNYKTAFHVSLRIRVDYTSRNKRSTFSLLYAPLRFESNSRQPIPAPIRFQNTTFEAGQPLRVRYQFSGYRFTYRYNFVRTQKLKAGLGLTLNIRDAYIKLGNGRQQDEEKNVGPVPLLNLYVNWQPAGRLGLLVEGDGFAVTGGRAVDVFAGLNYRIAPKVALKAGYRILEGQGGLPNGTETAYNQLWANFAAVGLTLGL